MEAYIVSIQRYKPQHSAACLKITQHLECTDCLFTFDQVLFYSPKEGVRFRNNILIYLFDNYIQYTN
jgi:hypothetical protein